MRPDNEKLKEKKKKQQQQKTKSMKQQIQYDQKIEQQKKEDEVKMKEDIEKAQQRFKQSSLSQRLQTENPFEEFKKAVEKAFIEDNLEQKNKKVFTVDKSFFKESEDVGMCLSMHQPWASLLVEGFKRFEGREWTHKFRGPLWIHATSSKPSQSEIEALEASYSEHYSSIGEDRPSFPERYPTSCLLGRVDLVDFITLEEYSEQVPKQLQEQTES